MTADALCDAQDGELDEKCGKYMEAVVTNRFEIKNGEGKIDGGGKGDGKGDGGGKGDVGGKRGRSRSRSLSMSRAVARVNGRLALARAMEFNYYIDAGVCDAGASDEGDYCL